ncbi:cation:proton antiporter [Chondromyces apiculatus]|uniref:TrkA-N:Sodium/hydrogen exchanger n=1 Tax=Chondromyces apiculatus DSM 436 TaxID=1192034 RepID=A0A017SVF5_9BACT|nr:cation:proton antiporter [Chondromyces apiculatus]EYF00968.1 TrkA-N:Sodium/hydrogen exchanger [Chondromyces apiculatus DSM 436]
MPHNLDLIFTLTGGLSAALVLGFITHRLKLSPIVGYLLAGIAVGPFTPGFVAHAGIAEQFAELGVILLMFGVGLHFHLKELLAVRQVALPGAIVQIAVATGLGVLVAHLVGWSSAAGVVFGLAISVASTVVLLRVLSDYDVLHTPAGHVAVGWLVVEDVFTVLVLVMLPVLTGPEAKGDIQGILLSVGGAVLKIGALVVFTLVGGQWVIPRLLGYVAKTRSRELFTLTVLVLALGIAVGSAKLFGASMALGAFLAGMVVGQSALSSRAASEVLPLRDAFAVLFFVSVGMLFDPKAIGANLGLVLATLAVVLVGKPVAAFAVVLLLRYPLKKALSVSVALAQIGEFSFILAALGRSLGVLPAESTPALVVASVVSITLNPLLFRYVEPASRWLSARWPEKADAPLAANPNDPTHRAVVVGYGPVGRTLTKLLKENQIEPTVIELNHETVHRLNREGTRAVYGDASQLEILERAGVKEASSLVFAASGSPADAVILAARALNPDIQVLARTTYVREVQSLKSVGASMVTAAEAEVALAMTEHLLTKLGATGEQLDRERARVRNEIASLMDGGTPPA